MDCNHLGYDHNEQPTEGLQLLKVCDERFIAGGEEVCSGVAVPQAHNHHSIASYYDSIAPLAFIYSMRYHLPVLRSCSPVGRRARRSDYAGVQRETAQEIEDVTTRLPDVR